MRKALTALLWLIVILVAIIIWAYPSHSTAPKVQAPKPATFNKAALSTTDPASLWVVVDAKHVLNPVTYAPAGLVSIGNNQTLRVPAAGALPSLLSAAQKAGFPATIQQGYVTAEAVAKSRELPGSDEMQTGLAVTLSSNTAGLAWLNANAYRYGFVPQFGHFRYVGSALAEQLHLHNQTLNQFMQ